ncbi:MAG: hypothetical protein FJW38_26130 [Acidobacteria bacterium]|nr:hypothetical protein [Acidobacteriota bacterium]
MPPALTLVLVFMLISSFLFLAVEQLHKLWRGGMAEVVIFVCENSRLLRSGELAAHTINGSMPLAAGAKLGHFEVVGPLGAGGMGEVYKARDTRLNREVALKVLPADFARDPQRKARFEQEARAVASLNHAGIVALYDIGVEDGVVYMVTELVDGTTLRDAGQLPPRKVQNLAVEIAEALAAAHAKGITHRDIKPENIMVTRDGHAKILDFGLAKGSVASGNETETAAGTVMGTAGYMSPEQARGEEIDHRSDVFSFGAVLYEMAGGARAFHKATVPETLAAIIREEPAELPDSPLRNVIQHCLEKVPEQRFQSMKDLAFALRSAGSATATSGAMKPTAPAKKKWLWPVACVASLAIGFLLAPKPGVAPQLVVKQLSIEDDWQAAPTYSPDGKSIAYVKGSGRNRSLMVRTVDGGEPVAIAKDVARLTANIHFTLFWSRDGGRIYYQSNQGLSQVSAAGGEPALLFADVRAAALLPGSDALVIPQAREGKTRFLVSDPPGSAPKERPGFPEFDGLFACIAFSPDGSKVCLMSGQGTDLSVAAWPAGPIRKLNVTGSPRRPQWFPDNRTVLVTQFTHRRIARIDTDTGSVEPIYTSVDDIVSAMLAPGAKSLVFANGIARSRIQEFGASGRAGPLIAPSIGIQSLPRWSADGQSIVFGSTAGPKNSIRIWNAATDEARSIVALDTLGSLTLARISPDNKRIAYNYGESLWTTSVLGGSPIKLLSHRVGPFAWSPDNRWLAFTEGRRILKLSTLGGAEPVRVAETTDGTGGGTAWIGDSIFAPSGNDIVRVSAEGGKPVKVASPGRVGISGHTADGRTLYVFENVDGGRPRVIPIDIASGAIGKAIDLDTDSAVDTVSVHPSGKRIAAMVRTSIYNLYTLEGFAK